MTNWSSNLLANPGFETETSLLSNGNLETWTGLCDLLADGGFEYWNTATTMQYWSPVSGSISRNASDVKVGTYSVQCTTTTAGQRPLRQSVYLTSGYKYIISGWMKSISGGTSVDVGWRDTDFSNAVTITTDWAYYTFCITATSTGNYFLDLGYHCPENSVWLMDGFSMYVSMSPTGWSVPNTATAILSRDEGTVHTGSYSAKLTRVGVNCWFSQTVTIPSNTSTYIMGAWVYQVAGAATRARIFMYLGANYAVAYHSGVATGWEYLSVAVVNPSQTSLIAYLGVNATNGDAHFNSVTAYLQVAPTGWNLSGTGATVAREEGIIKLGTYSAKLTYGTVPCYLLNSDYLDFKGLGTTYWKGRTLTFGCWVYSTGVQARLNFYDGIVVSQAIHSSTVGWEYLTITATVSATATSVEFTCRVTTSGYAYFDGVSVTDSVTGTVVINNAYFDVWAGLSPSSWTLTGTGAGFSKSIEQLQLGDYSGKLTRIGADTSISQTITTLAYKGKNLFLGAWVWASIPNVARVRAYDNILGAASSEYHSGSSKWEWLSIAKTTSASSSIINAYLDVVDIDTTVYFDDAEMFAYDASVPVGSDVPISKRVVADGHVENVYVVAGGSGYSSKTTVSISSPVGGAISYRDNYTLREFTTDDVFVPTVSGTMEAYVWGAGGAGGTMGGWTYGSPGGAGGYAYGLISVTAGLRYKVVVGNGGIVNGTAGAHGGGGPATNNNVDNRYAGGGGGLSGLFLNLFTQPNAILLAGGGGGGGSSRTGAGNAGGGGGGIQGESGYSPYPVTVDPIPTGGTITTDGLYTVHKFTSAGTFTPMKAGVVQVLVVGGGAGGASGLSGVNAGAGGGGGTAVYNAIYSVTTAPISVTIAASVSGGTGNGSGGTDGNSSIFGTITATGGLAPSATSRTGGGNATYTGGTNTTFPHSGGGAGAGGNGSGSNGGPGYISNILVSSVPVQYGGGGGGAEWGTTSGGGGTANVDGTPNTGGGGGGGTDPAANQHGGHGASGIVIVRYLTSSQLVSGSYAGNPGTQVAAGADATCTAPTALGLQAALQGGQVRANSYGGGGGGGYFGGSAGGYGEPSTMAGGGGGSAYYNPAYVTLPTLIPALGTIPGSPTHPYRGAAGSAGPSYTNGANGKVVLKYVTASMDVTTESVYTPVQAIATPTISAGGVITGISLTEVGSGYGVDVHSDLANPYPTVTITDPAGSGAGAYAICYVPTGLPITPSGDVRHHTITIMQDKSVKSWGYSENYQLCQGNTNNSTYLPMNAEFAMFVTNMPTVNPILCSMSSNSSYILDSLGRVFVGGYNGNYELGLGDNTFRSAYEQINPAYFGYSPVIKLKSSWNSSGGFAFALTANGKCYRWGYNNQGQLGNGTATNITIPTELTTPFGIVDFSFMGSSNYAGTMLLDAWGNVWVCGYNGYGNLSDGTTTARSTFQRYNTALSTPLTGASRVWGGGCDGSYIDSWVLCRDGRMYGAGYNVNGQLGNNTTTNTGASYCTRVLRNDLANFSCDKWWMQGGGTGGSTCSSYIRYTGTDTIYSFGYNVNGELGLGDTTTRLTANHMSQLFTAAGGAKVLEISSGHGSNCSYSVCQFNNGRTAVVGYNGNGQLGDGTTTNRSTWVYPKFQRLDVVKVRMAQVSSYGWLQILCSDGTLYVCGHGNNGELGHGQTINRYVLGEVLF